MAESIPVSRVTLELIQSAQTERKNFQRIAARLIDVAHVMELDDKVISEAISLQRSAAFSPPDSLFVSLNKRQSEGQINRLKLLKRQMYGRANIDLLRLRVLHRAA